MKESYTFFLTETRVSAHADGESERGFAFCCKAFPAARLEQYLEQKKFSQISKDPLHTTEDYLLSAEWPHRRLYLDSIEDANGVPLPMKAQDRLWTATCNAQVQRAG